MKRLKIVIPKTIAKMLLLSLITGICLANSTTMAVKAKESASVEEVTSLSDIPVYKDVNLNISDVTFQMTDIRDSSKVSTFNGADGKQAIMVFGGANCQNTLSALKYLNKLVARADMSKLNIYVFEIKGSDDNTIIANMGSVSDKIMLNSVENNQSYKDLYYDCYFSTVAGSYTMPLIVYKGTDGLIYSYTSGATTLSEIGAHVNAGGLNVDVSEPIIELNVTGKKRYDEAYEVLKLMNQERAAVGLSALVMDEDLLEAAMYRAAECALYYSHTRPDGTDCFTVSDEMSGENIAIGYRNADAVMNGWMNSEGHKANILRETFQSVGVGCFYTNGSFTWVQCFGNENSTEATQPKDQETTYAIKAAVDKVTPKLVENNGTLKVGSTKQLEIIAVQMEYFATYINADSYDWSSDSDVATVDSNGLVTGKKAGKAVITASNKAYPSQKLSYTVTVEANESEKAPLGDVPSNEWYYSSVKFAYENGLMNGKETAEDGTVLFDPANTITRAEFVRILFNKEGAPGVEYSAVFTDVPEGFWFTNAILWAYKNGIVSGKSEDFFDVDGDITRQEIAQILYKYAKFKKYDVSKAENTDITSFVDDEDVIDWARTAMKWAVGNQVVNGKETDGGYELSPNGNAIRAEAATMLRNFMRAFEHVDE